MKFTKQSILHRLNNLKNAKIPIIGGGAGCGLSAKSEENGGIDLIVIYNSGRYRMAGRGSLAGLLAYGNANEIVIEMGYEILPIIKNTPILAGVNGTDPFCMMDKFLRQIRDMGFAGVQNFPTVGLIDGVFRQNLEETGMSYQLEIAMIEQANTLDLLTTPYVFNVNEAKEMARVGADVIVVHLGLTTGGSIGAHSGISLQDSPKIVNDIADAVLTINDKAIILVHGGAVTNPDDAQFIFDNCVNCHGFYGASSMERLPVEKSISQQVKQFKNCRFP